MAIINKIQGVDVMVEKKKALIASIGSALVIGIIHYLAHSYYDSWTSATQNAGYVVMISVFVLGYLGMTRS